MGANNGKFFDVTVTNKYFNDLHGSFNMYQKNAKEHFTSLDTYGNTDQWEGVDADAAKHLLKGPEYQLLTDIIQVQKDVVTLQEELLEKFKLEVDSASDAYISYDDLETVNNAFQEYYEDFTDLDTKVIKKASYLQDNFGKYAAFTQPDSSSVKNSYVELCGGDDSTSGYMHECMQKLVKFDSAAKDLIEEKDLNTKIEELMLKMEVVNFPPDSEFVQKYLSAKSDKERADLKRAELKKILEKDVSQWTTYDAINVTNWYSEAAESHDTKTLEVLYNGLSETTLYKQSVNDPGYQENKDVYVSYLNRDKSMIMLNILSMNGKIGTEEFNSLYDMAGGGLTTVVDKGSAIPKCNISVIRNSVGTQINWETTVYGELASTGQHMMFDKDNLSLSQKYELIKDIDGLNTYRANLKSMKDAEAIENFESVSNNADFNEHCEYNKGQTTEGLFGIDILDSKYEYINSPSSRAYYNHTGSTYEDDGLEHLTDKQKKTYNYLYYLDTKNGTNKAEEYLTLLTPYLRGEEANEVYDSMKDSHLKQTGYEFGAGLEGVGTGIANLFGANDDLDGVAMKTTTQLVDEKITANATGGWKTVYAVSKGAGTALPGILITVGTGGLGTGFATAATATMYGLSTAGSTQAACEQSGYSQSESFNYGMAEGVKTGVKIAALGAVASELGGASSAAGSLTRTGRMLAMGKQAAAFGATTYAVEMVDQLYIEPTIGVNTLHDKTRADVDLEEANKQAFLAGVTAAGGYYVAGRVGQEMQARKAVSEPEPEVLKKTNFENEDIIRPEVNNDFEYDAQLYEEIFESQYDINYEYESYVDDVLAAGEDPVLMASANQGDARYPGIDSWENGSIKTGDIIYRGEPYGTEYFTDIDTVYGSGLDKKVLFKSLQVEEHPIFGYRSEMEAYIALDNISDAEAICLENSQYGSGGGAQKFIPNANELVNKGLLYPVDIVYLR